MHITNDLTDAAVLRELGARVAQARLARNVTQAELSAEAGVGQATLQRLERGHTVATTSLVRVLRALGLLETLDRAVPEPLPSPLAELQLRGRARRRAGHERGGGDADGWRWGDEGDAA